jgi:DNA topoisomerase-2
VSTLQLKSLKSCKTFGCQVSFCNSIATIRGGTHVQYVTDQIVNHILGVVNKKNKTAGVKPFQIKNHMWVFVNALIDNPTFDSQTKETLTSRAGSFGSKCELSEEFLKKGMWQQFQSILFWKFCQSVFFWKYWSLLSHE